LLIGLIDVGSRAVAQTAPVEWIVEDGNVLTLRLVLDEKKPCGGELQVDPNRRVVRFEGIPGDMGCRLTTEAAFEDVRAVRTQRKEAGFLLELAKDKGAKLVLIPLPHYRWFVQDYTRVRTGGLEARLGQMGVTDRDGESIRFGGGAAADRIEKAEVPSEVQADAQKAVDLIREAMGRSPAPVVALREALQGRPIDATLKELLEEPGSFASQPVRVRGQLARASTGEGFRLEDEGLTLALTPDPELAARLHSAGRWVGQEVEVAGRLRRREGAASDEIKVPTSGVVRPSADEYYISAWDCLGPEEARASEGQPVTLEALVTNPAAHEGEVVRVVGKFRGRNLYGDLPARSLRRGGDWVIKSDRYAVWVTGHKASGEGWALDPEASGTTEWVEVVGRAVARGGVTYVEASRVALTAAPAGARVRPARMIVSRSASPPVIVFTLPLDGETVDAAGRIVVQFAKNMDEESFKGRLRLRYAGPPGREGSDLPLRLYYDEGRRSLVIDPGRRLEPGRQLELALLPGIVDVDGLPLVPRRPVEGAVDMLSYMVSP
jgi:hypothetical protein